MSCNIVEWFKESEVRIISDPEGRDIMDMVKKSNEESYENKILILGDIIDSTNVDLSENKLNTTYNNIKNLINCVTNDNIKYVFGNRDINKLKVLSLTKLNNFEDSYYEKRNESLSTMDKDAYKDSFDSKIKRFNNCTEKLENLENYYNNLIQFFKSAIRWQAPMNHCYTFWSPNVGFGKDWSKLSDYNNTPFFTRFNEIF